MASGSLKETVYLGNRWAGVGMLLVAVVLSALLVFPKYNFPDLFLLVWQVVFALLALFAFFNAFLAFTLKITVKQKSIVFSSIYGTTEIPFASCTSLATSGAWRGGAVYALNFNRGKRIIFMELNVLKSEELVAQIKRRLAR